MKHLILSVLLSSLLFGCLKDGNHSSTFNQSYGEIISLPHGSSNQYLLKSYTQNTYFYPFFLPDSMKTDHLQIKFSGYSQGEYRTIKYTNPTNGETEESLFQTLDISNIARSQQNMKVSYGTRFGECVGYCQSSMTVTQAKLEFTYQGNDTISYPKIECSLSVPRDSTDQLIDYIRKGIIYNMNTVYGCPDCADGGAEWIEINHGTFTKKITFEYLNEPEEIRPYMNILRRLSTRSTCDPR